jgi:hypothetical protein
MLLRSNNWFNIVQYLNREWIRLHGFSDQLSPQTRDSAEFFVNLVTNLIDIVDDFTGTAKGYQLLDSILVVDVLQSALDHFGIGIVICDVKDTPGAQIVMCFDQSSGHILFSRSTQKSTGTDTKLIPKALFPKSFMYDGKSVTFGSVPGVLHRREITASVQNWLNDQFPEIVRGNRIEIRPLIINGCNIAKYLLVVVNKIVYCVIGLSDKHTPVEVYPLDWERKPNVVPRVAFLIMESIDPRIFSRRTVLDLGTGDFAFYALFSIWQGAKCAYGVEFDNQRFNNARRIVERANCANSIKIFKGDWYEPVSDQRFDLIITNPPYQVGVQDSNDFGGINGRRHIDHIVEHAADHLTEKGRLLIHHGSFLGVEDRLGEPACTFERCRKAGLKPSLGACFWLQANENISKATQCILSIYPKARNKFYDTGESWYYETAIIEGRVS